MPIDVSAMQGAVPGNLSALLNSWPRRGLLGGIRAPAAAAWDPNNPFGGAPDLLNVIRNMLAYSGRGGELGGVFGPNYLLDQLRTSALGTARAGNERASILSSVLGLDPMQTRGALVNADISGQNALSHDLNQASLYGHQGYLDFIRGLLNSERSGENTGFLMNRQAQLQQQANRGSLGSMLGSVVGTGLGAFTGGVGKNFAAQLFQ